MVTGALIEVSPVRFPHAFAGAPAMPFTVYGAQPSSSAAVIGLGFYTGLTDSASIYARYDGEINGRNDAHAFSAGLRVTW